MIKINLGSGPNVFKGWLNLDSRGDQFPGAVRWRWNERIPCDDEAADLVVVQHALMYCKERDYDINLREIRRVLVYGGILLIKEDDDRRRKWYDIGRRDASGRIGSSTNPVSIKPVLERNHFGNFVWRARALVRKYPGIINRIPNLLCGRFFAVECEKMH